MSRTMSRWAWAALLAACAGCTSESTRLAIEAQRRVDTVEQTLFDRQHESLCRLLYRDVVHRLGAEGVDAGAVLNEAWNDRDLIEFWAQQHERARALRTIAVDTKLYSEQSIIDLLWKSLESRLNRAQQALVTAAAETQAPGAP